jgi:hypothetical protein
MCFKQRWTINIVPFRKWLMRETGCTSIQAGISRAEPRFARHDFETDGNIPRSGGELNPAFRKPKALRIVGAMKGAQGQAVPACISMGRASQGTRGSRWDGHAAG